MNYEEMTIDQLNKINDDFDAQIQKIKEKRRELNLVRHKKIKVEQVRARYGKIKSEDVAILNEIGAFDQVITPEIITTSSKVLRAN